MGREGGEGGRAKEGEESKASEEASTQASRPTRRRAPASLSHFFDLPLIKGSKVQHARQGGGSRERGAGVDAAEAGRGAGRRRARRAHQDEVRVVRVEAGEAGAGGCRWFSGVIFDWRAREVPLAVVRPVHGEVFVTVDDAPRNHRQQRDLGSESVVCLAC